MPHRTQPRPPGPTLPRRLVAVGFIRRTTGRILTLDATSPRVTGTIRPAAAAPFCCGRPMRDEDGQYVCPRCGAWTQQATRASHGAEQQGASR